MVLLSGIVGIFIHPKITIIISIGTIGFVGSHLDVVPANPANWKRNPFKLVVEVIVTNPIRVS